MFEFCPAVGTYSGAIFSVSAKNLALFFLPERFTQTTTIITTAPPTTKNGRNQIRATITLCTVLTKLFQPPVNASQVREPKEDLALYSVTSSKKMETVE